MTLRVNDVSNWLKQSCVSSQSVAWAVEVFTVDLRWALLAAYSQHVPYHTHSALEERQGELLGMMYGCV